MQVEWYAPVIVLIGISLWLRGSVLGSVVALLFFSLFGGGAAFIVAHSSIQPAAFMIVFLLAHLLLSMFSRSGHANIGLKTNGWLAFYCIYGAMSAFILPKIFAKALAVTPMTAHNPIDLYITTSLHYSTQNLTAAIYLIGTLVASIGAGAATADPKSRETIVGWAVVLSWIHIFFGVAGEVLGPGSEFIRLFRNATYAELTQVTAGGVARISGVFPEPSAYAGYAFGWFVFMFELWLRDVRPRLTFVTAAALGAMIIACTSSAGYVSLAVYALLMGARFAIEPRSFSLAKAIQLALAALAAVTVVLAAIVLAPHVGSTIERIIKDIVLGKLDTSSGRQRLYFVATGIKAFAVTGGLGVGAGSFRSSSLLVAILGSTGIVGFVAFAGHFFKILKPLRRSTYVLAAGDRVGAAAAWGACAGLIPAMLSSSTPDPSFLFAVMGGLSLGWRYAPTMVHARSKAPRPVARRVGSAPRAARPA